MSSGRTGKWRVATVSWVGALLACHDGGVARQHQEKVEVVAPATVEPATVEPTPRAITLPPRPEDVYVAYRQDGRIVVDAEFAAQASSPWFTGRRRAYDPKAVTAPELQLGATWTIAWEGGGETRRVTRVTPHTGPEDDQPHARMDLGLWPGHDSMSLAWRGRMKLSPDTVFREQRYIGHRDPWPDLIDRVQVSLATECDAAQIHALELEPVQASLKATHGKNFESGWDKATRVYEGRFPAGRTHVVFVNVSVPADAADDEAFADPIFPPPHTVSAVFFAHSDGELEMVAKPERFGGYGLIGILDLDGDQIDELVFRRREGVDKSVHLLYWDEDIPAERPLAPPCRAFLPTR